MGPVCYQMSWNLTSDLLSQNLFVWDPDIYGLQKSPGDSNVQPDCENLALSDR